MFCSAPSFLKGLLSTAKKEQLKTIRLFVTGAEKTPKSLFDKIKEFGQDKKLIEGYGITECSPIISISRINEPKKGVGKLLPGIEACLINPDTHELIDQKGEGEICVRSPSVFKGYIGKQKSPFVEINKKKWYMTGDLGYIEDGSIILSGRLKRFCKIAGEMVSLGGIEEIVSHEIFLNKQVGLDEDHQLAVVAKEKEDDKSKLILFTTLDIKMQDVNLILKDAGLSRLVKISEVKKVDEIPLLGTGKTDYRSLQSLLG